jgi:hypothetical protein
MNKSVGILFIALWLLSSLTNAQMNEFQKEFMQANRQFISERTLMVTQRYIFSLDSANAIPFDSGYCFIEKNGLSIHYEFNGMESFTDGTYLIRISNPGKYMVVSKSDHADSSAPGFIFKEGFSGFKNVEKKNTGADLSQWKLSGGTNGVQAVEITFDTRKTRIMNILAELLPDHPFVSQINTHKPGTQHNVFIRIDYAYSTKLSKEQPKLSDYIYTENDVITPAKKLKDYQIKFIK